jgi:pimeloyl-ACP methyl ester carboxylesterase
MTTIKLEKGGGGLTWCLVTLSILAGGCAGSSPGAHQSSTQVEADAWQRIEVKTDSFRLVDPSRQRTIPVLTYAPASGAARKARLKLALLNHGYGGHNSDYSFVARNLVAHGYFVASLQQDLPGDVPMPTTGEVYKNRYSYWERGVQSMRYVLRQLPRTYPELDTRHLLLVGHSNGGDMVMLFAKEYPGQVERLISLDNRRVPLPRARRPKVLSLRSSDQVADSGVLPTSTEQARFGTQLVQLPATLHNDMWDGATSTQQQEMNAAISQFLEK